MGEFTSCNAHAPRRVVAHVVGMVDLAVEQLHADGHAVVFRDLLHAIEPGDGVACAFVVGHAAADTPKVITAGTPAFAASGMLARKSVSIVA